MAFSTLNYLAVLTAAVAGFIFGALWYTLLGKAWMAALRMTEKPKPKPSIFALTLLCQLFMAWMLAGLIGHVGAPDLRTSMISAAFVWAGFIATTMLVNHRFQGQGWKLSLIDVGHWLGVLLVMGAVFGLFGG